MPMKFPPSSQQTPARRRHLIRSKMQTTSSMSSSTSNNSQQIDRRELMQIMADKAKTVFSLCDHEKKGFITKRDMYRLEDELPLTLEQLENVFDSLDVQKQGYLTLYEFTNGFGSFVGLSPTSPSVLNSPEIEFQNEDTNNGHTDNNNNQSENFNNLLKNFSQCGMIEDIKIMKSLWYRMNKHQPEMLKNFEDFVSRMVDALQRTHLDYKALQTSIENHKNAHDEEIHSLYAQMETQIQEEKDRIHAEEKEREKKLREKLELELQERDKRLQELMVQQKEMERKLKEVNRTKQETEEENEQLILEKQVIEKKFSDSKLSLQETRAKVNELEDRQEGPSQKQITVEIVEWIDLERQNLLKQIEDLTIKNKELKDLNDEIEDRMISPRRMEHSLDEDDKQDGETDEKEKMLSDGFIRNFSVDDDYVANDIEIISNYSSEDDSSLDDSLVANRMYKVVLVGDSNVGKTTFIQRVCTKSFQSTLSSTIGVDFQVCNVKVDKQVVAIQLWDTAGQERFRSLSRQYFRKADGVIMMYDVTNHQSFFNVRSWLDDVQSSVEPGTSLMLLGSKRDLIVGDGDLSTYIYPGEARKLAFDYNASFFETSSITGQNIDECIKYMSRVLRDREDQTIAKTINVLSHNDEQNQSLLNKNSCGCNVAS